MAAGNPRFTATCWYLQAFLYVSRPFAAYPKTEQAAARGLSAAPPARPSIPSPSTPRDQRPIGTGAPLAREPQPRATRAGLPLRGPCRGIWTRRRRPRGTRRTQTAPAARRSRFRSFAARSRAWPASACDPRQRRQTRTHERRPGISPPASAPAIRAIGPWAHLSRDPRHGHAAGLLMRVRCRGISPPSSSSARSRDGTPPPRRRQARPRRRRRPRGDTPSRTGVRRPRPLRASDTAHSRPVLGEFLSPYCPLLSSVAALVFGGDIPLERRTIQP